MKAELHSLQNYNKTVKLITLGDTDVGKTSFIKVYTRGVNKDDVLRQKTTLGVDFVSHSCKHKEVNFTLHVYDTAGQQRFRSIIMRYFTDAQGVFLVFSLSQWYDLMYPEDILQEEKLQRPQQKPRPAQKKKQEPKQKKPRLQPVEQIRSWLNTLEEQDLSHIDMVLVGNKIDLVKNRPHFQEFIKKVEQATEIYTTQLKTKVFFTSAITGENIQDAAQYLVSKLYRTFKASVIEQQLPPMEEFPPQIFTKAPRNSIILDRQDFEEQNMKKQQKNQKKNVRLSKESPKKKKSCC